MKLVHHEKLIVGVIGVVLTIIGLFGLDFYVDVIVDKKFNKIVESQGIIKYQIEDIKKFLLAWNSILKNCDSDNNGILNKTNKLPSVHFNNKERKNLQQNIYIKSTLVITYHLRKKIKGEFERYLEGKDLIIKINENDIEALKYEKPFIAYTSKTEKKAKFILEKANKYMVAKGLKKIDSIKSISNNKNYIGLFL